MEPTYRALIRPIPERLNLANAATQEPNESCQHCSLLVPDRSKIHDGLIRTSFERVDLFPDFPELKASAKAGCGFCRLIRKTIRSAWAIRPMEEWGVGPLGEKDSYWDILFSSTWDGKVRIHNASFSLSTIPTAPEASSGKLPDSLVVSLSMEFGPLNQPPPIDGEQGHSDIGQVISFKVFDQQDLDASKEQCQRQLPAIDTLSKANLTMLFDWIDDCKTSHATCRVQNISWLPGRLLDVGPSDGTQAPCLVETSAVNIQGGYAALSYMWGDMTHRPPLRTLISNYVDMKLAISMFILPRNFVHAIVVTRRLGLRYLWIDSLCIIQDSMYDRKREAATMHEVYKYAEVTIVA